MPGPLLYRLMLVSLAVVAVVMLAVWVAIDTLAAGYFATLMEQYHISPVETHRMFLDSVHRHLLGAGVAALLVAGALSYVLTRRVLRPLTEMSAAVERLAAGDYGARARVAGDREARALARAFNHLADGLQEVERLRQDMVADVAHELRTPLTNVRGYLEAMEEEVIAPSAEHIRLLQGEVARLIHLVEDLQRLSRADGAKGHLERTDIAVESLLERLLALYRPALESRRVRLETRLDPAVGSVWADEDKLLQVLGNLLHNAARFVPDGGWLQVAVEARAGGWRFAVSNSGPPLPEEGLPRLFERFYRAEGSRSRASGGAGIGLAIVSQLVVAHGGRVGAENVPGGVCFWFTLPPAPPAGPASLPNLYRGFVGP